MNKVYRVWFDSSADYGVCCVLVSAETEERALELAKEEIKCFPVLQNAPYRISVFDTSTENAAIC